MERKSFSPESHHLVNKIVGYYDKLDKLKKKPKPFESRVYYSRPPMKDSMDKEESFDERNPRRKLGSPSHSDIEAENSRQKRVDKLKSIMKSAVQDSVSSSRYQDSYENESVDSNPDRTFKIAVKEMLQEQSGKDNQDYQNLYKSLDSRNDDMTQSFINIQNNSNIAPSTNSKDNKERYDLKSSRYEPRPDREYMVQDRNRASGRKEDPQKLEEELSTHAFSYLFQKQLEPKKRVAKMIFFWSMINETLWNEYEIDPLEFIYHPRLKTKKEDLRSKGSLTPSFMCNCQDRSDDNRQPSIIDKINITNPPHKRPEDQKPKINPYEIHNKDPIQFQEQGFDVHLMVGNEILHCILYGKRDPPGHKHPLMVVKEGDIVKLDISPDSNKSKNNAIIYGTVEEDLKGKCDFIVVDEEGRMYPIIIADQIAEDNLEEIQTIKEEDSVAYSDYVQPAIRKLVRILPTTWKKYEVCSRLQKTQVIFHQDIVAKKIAQLQRKSRGTDVVVEKPRKGITIFPENQDENHVLTMVKSRIEPSPVGTQQTVYEPLYDLKLLKRSEPHYQKNQRLTFRRETNRILDSDKRKPKQKPKKDKSTKQSRVVDYFNQDDYDQPKSSKPNQQASKISILPSIRNSSKKSQQISHKLTFARKSELTDTQSIPDSQDISVISNNGDELEFKNNEIHFAMKAIRNISDCQELKISEGGKLESKTFNFKNELSHKQSITEIGRKIRESKNLVVINDTLIIPVSSKTMFQQEFIQESSRKAQIDEFNDKDKQPYNHNIILSDDEEILETKNSDFQNSSYYSEREIKERFIKNQPHYQTLSETNEEGYSNTKSVPKKRDLDISEAQTDKLSPRTYKESMFNSGSEKEDIVDQDEYNKTLEKIFIESTEPQMAPCEVYDTEGSMISKGQLHVLTDPLAFQFKEAFSYQGVNGPKQVEVVFNKKKILVADQDNKYQIYDIYDTESFEDPEDKIDIVCFYLESEDSDKRIYLVEQPIYPKITKRLEDQTCVIYLKSGETLDQCLVHQNGTDEENNMMIVSHGQNLERFKDITNLVVKFKKNPKKVYVIEYEEQIETVNKTLQEEYEQLRIPSPKFIDPNIEQREEETQKIRTPIKVKVCQAALTQISRNEQAKYLIPRTLVRCEADSSVRYVVDSCLYLLQKNSNQYFDEIEDSVDLEDDLTNKEFVDNLSLFRADSKVILEIDGSEEDEVPNRPNSEDIVTSVISETESHKQRRKNIAEKLKDLVNKQNASKLKRIESDEAKSYDFYSATKKNASKDRKKPPKDSIIKTPNAISTISINSIQQYSETHEKELRSLIKIFPEQIKEVVECEEYVREPETTVDTFNIQNIEITEHKDIQKLVKKDYQAIVLPDASRKLEFGADSKLRKLLLESIKNSSQTIHKKSFKLSTLTRSILQISALRSQKEHQNEIQGYIKLVKIDSISQLEDKEQVHQCIRQISPKEETNKTKQIKYKRRESEKRIEEVESQPHTLQDKNSSDNHKSYHIKEIESDDHNRTNMTHNRFGKISFKMEPNNKEEDAFIFTGFGEMSVVPSENSSFKSSLKTSDLDPQIQRSMVINSQYHNHKRQEGYLMATSHLAERRALENQAALKIQRKWFTVFERLKAKRMVKILIKENLGSEKEYKKFLVFHESMPHQYDLMSSFETYRNMMKKMKTLE